MTMDTQGKELACIERLGTLCAMSEWTEDQLKDILNLLRDYGASCEYDGYQTGFNEGYNTALSDAVEAAQRTSVG